MFGPPGTDVHTPADSLGHGMLDPDPARIGISEVDLGSTHGPKVKHQVEGETMHDVIRENVHVEVEIVHRDKVPMKDVNIHEVIKGQLQSRIWCMIMCRRLAAGRLMFSTCLVLHT